ncbi:hypothetical protein ACFE04_005277 [Oxalis oulophora]
MSATTTSTPATHGTSKLSMFTKKTGFVIPKNKLAASFLPIPRGGKKPGDHYDSVQEETNKQVQRKTKWGPDLTQDAAVKKQRALAYQQLNISLFRWGTEMSGEILKLNPNYKAPADYKPVLKEATVHIPVKKYPRYNFVGLIFGPERETQKRFEKDTGAKIKVCGTKASSAEKMLKVEVSPADGNGISAVYEELHVVISADTYEKVDAAVSLIELLITSVSDNIAAESTSTSVCGDNMTGPNQNVDNPYIGPTAPMNQETVQSLVRPTQFPPQGQFQYQVPWFRTNPDQTPMPPTGFSNSSSVPMFNNPANSQIPPANANPLNLPSLFGSQLSSIASAHPPNPQNNLLPFPFTGAQHPLTPTARPLMPLSTGSGWGPRPQIASSTASGMPHVPSSFHSHLPAIQSSTFHSNAGSMANFNTMNPRPQHPSPRDFMFQHQPPQNPALQMLNQHPLNQNVPSFRLGGSNSTPQMLGPQFPGNPMDLMGQPPFSGNSNSFSAPHGHSAPSYSQWEGPRNFNAPSHMPREYDNTGPFHHPRQWNPMHNPMHSRQENHMVPNQRFGGNLPFGQQIHDRFLHSPPPVRPQQQGRSQSKQENDPEYEDLMASVGVK